MNHLKQAQELEEDWFECEDKEIADIIKQKAKELLTKAEKGCFCGHSKEHHKCYGRFPNGCNQKSDKNGTICNCKEFKLTEENKETIKICKEILA